MGDEMVYGQASGVASQAHLKAAAKPITAQAVVQQLSDEPELEMQERQYGDVGAGGSWQDDSQRREAQAGWQPPKEPAAGWEQGTGVAARELPAEAGGQDGGVGISQRGDAQKGAAGQRENGGGRQRSGWDAQPVDFSSMVLESRMPPGDEEQADGDGGLVPRGAETHQPPGKAVQGGEQLPVAASTASLGGAVRREQPRADGFQAAPAESRLQSLPRSQAPSAAPPAEQDTAGMGIRMGEPIGDAAAEEGGSVPDVDIGDTASFNGAAPQHGFGAAASSNRLPPAPPSAEGSADAGFEDWQIQDTHLPPAAGSIGMEARPGSMAPSRPALQREDLGTASSASLQSTALQSKEQPRAAAAGAVDADWQPPLRLANATFSGRAAGNSTQGASAAEAAGLATTRPRDICIASQPCGENAACEPHRSKKWSFRCTCLPGFKGNPYSSSSDKCRALHELFLDELFGITNCYGCPYVPAIVEGYPTGVSSVLDLGSGGCQVLRQLRKRGFQAEGVEMASFPLDAKCQDLRKDNLVLQAPLDHLPYPNDNFDLVLALHVLEYLPLEKLNAVLAEMARVARLRVLVVVQLPKMKEAGMGAMRRYGVQVETLFPETWWVNRLMAAGLRPMLVREDIIRKVMSRHGKRIKDPVAILAMGKEPERGSVAQLAASSHGCWACDYMPLLYHMYAPPRGMEHTKSEISFRHNPPRFGKVLAISPHVCRVVRGMSIAKAKSLTRVVGLTDNEFVAERDCPNMIVSKDIRIAPVGYRMPEGRQLAEPESFDTVMLLFALDLLPDDRASDLLDMAVAAARKRVLVLVHSCGRDYLSSDCEARSVSGVVNLKTQAEWEDMLMSRKDLEVEDFPHVWRRRTCHKGEATDTLSGEMRLECPSIYDSLRLAGEHEIHWSNIFPMRKVKPRRDSRPREHDNFFEEALPNVEPAAAASESLEPWEKAIQAYVMEDSGPDSSIDSAADEAISQLEPLPTEATVPGVFADAIAQQAEAVAAGLSGAAAAAAQWRQQEGEEVVSLAERLKPQGLGADRFNLGGEGLLVPAASRQAGSSFLAGRAQEELQRAVVQRSQQLRGNAAALRESRLQQKQQAAAAQHAQQADQFKAKREGAVPGLMSKSQFEAQHGKLGWRQEKAQQLANAQLMGEGGFH